MFSIHEELTKSALQNLTCQKHQRPATTMLFGNSWNSHSPSSLSPNLFIMVARCVTTALRLVLCSWAIKKFPRKLNGPNAIASLPIKQKKESKTKMTFRYSDENDIMKIYCCIIRHPNEYHRVMLCRSYVHTTPRTRTSDTYTSLKFIICAIAIRLRNAVCHMRTSIYL